MLLFWKVNFNTFSASFISWYTIPGALNAICRMVLMESLPGDWIYLLPFALKLNAVWLKKEMTRWNIQGYSVEFEDLCGIIPSTCWYSIALCRSQLLRWEEGLTNLRKKCPLTLRIGFSPLPVTLENYKYFSVLKPWNEGNTNNTTPL